LNDELQPLTFGSVGAGRDRDDALLTASRDWAMYAGEPLIRALGVRIGTEPQKIGGFFVYAGWTGIYPNNSAAILQPRRQLLPPPAHPYQLQSGVDPFTVIGLALSTLGSCVDVSSAKQLICDANRSRFLILQRESKMRDRWSTGHRHGWLGREKVAAFLLPRGTCSRRPHISRWDWAL